MEQRMVYLLGFYDYVFDEEQMKEYRDKIELEQLQSLLNFYLLTAPEPMMSSLDFKNFLCEIKNTRAFMAYATLIHEYHKIHKNYITAIDD